MKHGASEGAEEVAEARPTGSSRQISLHPKRNRASKGL